MDKNQVLSRLFVLLGAYIPSDMLVARNKYERVEKVLDHAFWLAFGVVVPIFLERVFNNKYAKAIRDYAKLPTVSMPKSNNRSLYQKTMDLLEGQGRHSPLQLPFEWLGKNVKNHDPKELAVYAKNMGLENNVSRLKALLSDPKFLTMVRKCKFAILMADLGLMALNGQLSVWIKNFVTEITSQKKGFSGVFEYADDQYLKETSADYEANKKKRMLMSLGLMAWSVVSLPLILRGLMKLPNKGLLKPIKNMTKLFNYADTVYMSRWVFLWYSVHNYVLAGAMAARGKDERREHLTRALTLDFFYAIGDLLIASAFAKGIQKFAKNKLKGVSILTNEGKSMVPKKLGRILQEVNGDKTHPAYRLAKMNFWGSLSLTTLFLGLSIPLMNIWYTKQSVLKEQRQRIVARLFNTHQRHLQPEFSLLRNAFKPVSSVSG